MANVTSLLTSLCNNFKDSASTSNSGYSQLNVTNLSDNNAITTRSGKTLEGPSTPLVPTPSKLVAKDKRSREDMPYYNRECECSPSSTEQISAEKLEDHSDILRVRDELAPLDSLPTGMMIRLLTEDLHEKIFICFTHNHLLNLDDNFKF
ncbi:hypothetical protein Tco_0797786 [Tanacetum coccineum]